MKSVTALFGYLGKSGSKTNTPEEGDTRVTIPGIINPVLEIPFPVFALYNAPLPGGNVPVNSFIYGEELLFNVNSSPTLFPLGPGLWDISVLCDLRAAGGVQDLTSTYRVELLDTTTGISVVLARLANDGTKPQNIFQSWRQLVTADQTYTVIRTSLVGLGTGPNLAHLVVKCIRLF